MSKLYEIEKLGDRLTTVSKHKEFIKEAAEHHEDFAHKYADHLYRNLLKKFREKTNQI